MTTYSIQIALKEGAELAMMDEALTLYIKHCHREIGEEKGEAQELYAKLEAAERTKSSLYSNFHQTSGNNFSSVFAT